MAGDLGGWFRRLLGRGHKNGNGASTLDGNGSSTPQRIEGKVQVLAKREKDREASALIIQEGIRDLSSLLRGIEGRLKVQNDHGVRLGNRIEVLAEAMRSMPSHGEKSEAMLDSIRQEMQRQGKMGQEVAGYFRTIPRILQNLEAGGSARKTQLELARGLVREVVSQGQKLTAFQRGAAEMAGAVQKLSTLGEEQLACLKGVEEGIRSGFESAGRAQAKATAEWGRRYRWATIGGISLLAIGILLLGAGLVTNLLLTRGMIQEIRGANAQPAEATAPAAEAIPIITEVAPEGGSVGAGPSDAIEPPVHIMTDPLPPPDDTGDARRIGDIDGLWDFWLP